MTFGWGITVVVVGAGVMVIIALPLLALKLLSPAYASVRLFEPVGSWAVVSSAKPWLFSAYVPASSGAPLFVIVTLPVGHPVAPGAFCAHASPDLLVTFIRKTSSDPYGAVVAFAFVWPPVAGSKSSRAIFGWLASALTVTGIAGENMLDPNVPSPAY
jgi:hypothetical protein